MLRQQRLVLRVQEVELVRRRAQLLLQLRLPLVTRLQPPALQGTDP